MIFTKRFQIGYKLLNKLNPTTPTSIKEISSYIDESIHFLEKVGKKLKDKGIIKTVRGPGGGYILIKEVSALELMFALEPQGHFLKNYPNLFLLDEVKNTFHNHIIGDKK